MNAGPGAPGVTRAVLQHQVIRAAFTSANIGRPRRPRQSAAGGEGRLTSATAMDEERGSPVPELGSRPAGPRAVRARGRGAGPARRVRRQLPPDRAATGASCVLKVMHPARERALVDLQCAALEHLAARAPDLALPRVVRTRDGRADRRGRRARAARRAWSGCSRYVAGHAARRGAAAHARSCSRSLGPAARRDGPGAPRLHASGGRRRDLKWDLARAGWIRDALRRRSRTRPAGAGRARSSTATRPRSCPRSAGLRRSVIHGDANDYNVIVGDPHRAGRAPVERHRLRRHAPRA